MKKVLWIVVLVVVVVAVFLIRPNKSESSLYSCFPENVLMTCEISDLNGEIDFINSLGFADGDILAPMFAECDDGERTIVELLMDILGNEFVVGYKKGNLKEKAEVNEEIVMQDVFDNLIMVSKPVKQISVSIIEKSLSQLIDDVAVTEYDGVTINTFEVDDSEEPLFMSYCVADGVVIGTFSLETMQQSIDLLTGKADDNFTQTELYQKLAAGQSESDVCAFSCDMSEFMTGYVETLDALLTSDLMNSQTNTLEELQSQIEMFKDMYDGLGDAVGYMGRNDTEFYTRSCGNFEPSKLDDFYKSIMMADKSVSDMTKFHVKDPVVSYAVNLGLQEYVSLILGSLPVDEVAEMKSSFAEDTGLDFDTFIGCMGNGVSLGIDEFEYTALVPNISLRMLVGVSESPDALMPALTKLAGMTGMPLENKNIGGADITYANIPMTVLKPGFAVQGDEMMFATSLDVMKELVQGVNAGESLNSNVEFAEFLGDEDLFGWYYVDINKIIDILDNMYTMFKPFMAGKVPEEIMADDEIQDTFLRAKMLQKLYMKAYTKGDEYYSEMVIKYDKDYEPVVEEVEVIGIQQ